MTYAQVIRKAVGLTLAFSLAGAFGSALAKSSPDKGRTQCFRGEVVSISQKTTKNKSRGSLSVRYQRGKKTVVRNLSLTKSQYDRAIGRSVRRGSQVKSCFNTKKPGTLIGSILNLAPPGEEGTFGSVDNPRNGLSGGGGPSGGGGS